ncbi:hypothetical protein A2803_00495 [Candidatus Woesebacteria bacterium RIFCSPHIGHO2_01_FULL_44_21]|uniref:MazF family transcriptional regulator n=1 Tax=Candidatus Woesebacteria bacterium RIFCSPHIGHO2_01_FULL_44_21 TaxID=1802503 RepID=A0A1F7YWB1_9BACT|nr:MAG: hypothetical protein A2803_00495 [Candidatus Woesebacteria bacterium RIFCSPHIGHO2_01_FULL_44_21]OGM68952.1 MAG: hypothetical protein A2897_02270 [Candidatus Woesebacteria bacterium RIFCSPLOWO2_01_FULL_44_24b]
MGKLAAGDIVLVTFPFSNLKGQKVRPALVLARAEFGNFILCQITSKPYSSKTSIQIKLDNFESGSLPVVSYARLDKLFTADQTLIKNVAGKLRKQTRNRILKRVHNLFV